MNDDFWQQVDNEERRRYEEEEERDAWEARFNRNRHWWYLIDQDKGWIAKVTND